MPDALLQELHARYGGQILARCRYLLRDDDDARDAAQDVFLKAIEHFPTFRQESLRSTWLIRIATNHCLNILRMRRNDARLAVAEGRVPGLDPTQLSSADRAERHALVRQLLAMASPEEAEIAVLYYVDELTQEEIATVVNRSLPTIRKRLASFTEMARQVLSRSGPESPGEVASGGSPESPLRLVSVGPHPVGTTH